MKELLVKYKSLISYLFFGGCTTLINIITYYFCAHIFSFSTIISTVIAWVLAVVFAYVTNKIWVFECKSWEISILINEVIAFFACRMLTGLLDIVIMAVCVDMLHFNDIIIKAFSNILVIILNYVASRLVVFKRSN